MASAKKGDIIEKKAAEYSRESPEHYIAANRQRIRYASRGTYIFSREA